ncbi:hypothetical protein NDU88_003480 [Pleurodeles waltl]|uniref:Uncharacterized protein n=1 Tax=Pleurodeles waltl TaxID=8319 RepID=A0AAV7TNR0_PLEWA|nr:hypothetical protein NDU88_003480 [Pleurodeles waltl]
MVTTTLPFGTPGRRSMVGMAMCGTRISSELGYRRLAGHGLLAEPGHQRNPCRTGTRERSRPVMEPGAEGAAEKAGQTPTDEQDNAKDECKQNEKATWHEEPSAKVTDTTKAWVGGATQGAGVGKLASEYIRPSPGDTHVIAREAGLANLIPLAAKEKIWRKEFIDLFLLLEVRHGGLDLTTCDKKDEDRRERRGPRVERSIENWLWAFLTLACMFVEKFPESAAGLFLHEQRVHATQLKYQGDPWLRSVKRCRRGPIELDTIEGACRLLPSKVEEVYQDVADPAGKTKKPR